MRIQNVDVKVMELLQKGNNVKTLEPYEVWYFLDNGDEVELTYHPQRENVRLQPGMIINCSYELTMTRTKKRKQNSNEYYWAKNYYGKIFNVIVKSKMDTVENGSKVIQEMQPKPQPQPTPNPYGTYQYPFKQPQPQQMQLNPVFTSNSKTEVNQAFPQNEEELVKWAFQEEDIDLPPDDTEQGEIEHEYQV